MRPVAPIAVTLSEAARMVCMRRSALAELLERFGMLRKVDDKRTRVLVRDLEAAIAAGPPATPTSRPPARRAPEQVEGEPSDMRWPRGIEAVGFRASPMKSRGRDGARVYWRVRWSVAGKRRERALGWLTRCEAERELLAFAQAESANRDRAAALGAMAFAPDRNITVSELLDAWLEQREVEGQKAASTLSVNRSCATRLGLIGAVPVAKLDTATIERYRRARLAGGRGRRAVKAGTVQGEFQVLRMALAWGIDAGLAPIDTLPRFPANPYRPDRSARPPELRVLRLVMAELEERDPLVWMGLRFQMMTGVRRGELVRLTWSAVNWDASTIRVVGKTSPRRRAPREQSVHPDVLHLLRELRTYRREVDPHRKMRPERVIGRTDHGWSRRVSKVLAKLPWEEWGVDEIDRLRPHDLRAQMITEMHRAGVPLKVISRQLGVSEAELLKTYVTVSRDDMAAAAARVNVGALLETDVRPLRRREGE